jgi:opacity protein-like surface antigen
MKIWTIVGVFILGTTAFAQMAEFGISGGQSRFPDKLIGVLPGAGNSGEDLNIKQDNGFRLAFHITLNTARFWGHEFGYAYNRSQFIIDSAQSGQLLKQGMAVHQGFYDFLLYATPEGTKIRPFVAGGGQFSNFTPPGTSATQGGGSTKFGFNYGAGIKVRVSSMFLVRLDYREYRCGRPNYFGSGVQINQSGLIRQQAISAGLSFVL